MRRVVIALGVAVALLAVSGLPALAQTETPTPVPPPQCGNTICQAGETCENCPADCGACTPGPTPTDTPDVFPPGPPTSEPPGLSTATPLVVQVAEWPPFPTPAPTVPDGIGAEPAIAQFYMVILGVFATTYMIFRFFNRSQVYMILTMGFAGVAMATGAYDGAVIVFVLWLAYSLIWGFQDSLKTIFGAGG